MIDKVAAAVMLQAWLDSGGPARAAEEAAEWASAKIAENWRQRRDPVANWSTTRGRSIGVGTSILAIIPSPPARAWRGLAFGVVVVLIVAVIAR